MKRMFASRNARWAFGSLGTASAAAIIFAKCASKVEDKSTSTPDWTRVDVNGRTFSLKANDRRVHIVPPDFAPTSVWDFNWDRRDPRFLKSKVWEDDKNNNTSVRDDSQTLKHPTARRTLYLVRHGQYDSKADHDHGHILTPTGEEQAGFLGKRLAESGIKFSSVVSSEMIRAKQTAELMMKEMGQAYPCLKYETKDPILNEGPPCIPEPPYRNRELWDPDYNEFYAEGARIEAAFRKYFHRADVDQKEDSHEIIVCHANVIRYFTMRALQFPPEAWLRIGLDHSSITRISLLPNGDVILRGLGDSGHLPASKTTQ